ncbi:MAG TPA: RDD family protein [Candidatus Angelobacter sp.]|nr:RDD family protein [Candidatus Angelobacter sp.]
MACQFCGGPYPCAHEVRAEVLASTKGSAASKLARQSPAIRVPARSTGAERAIEEAWRQEVASRVQQHRARRKRRGDENSLSLNFPADALPSPASELVVTEPEEIARPEPPKIIQFPRVPLVRPFVSPEPLELREELELAASVVEQPRILYAPEAEQMDFLSSFADIQLEAEQPREQVLMELPPQAAPLQSRAVSCLLDFALVFGATSVFSAGVFGFAGWPAHSRLALPCILAAGVSLWLIFQYIFLVYGQMTPGMKKARLELCTFSGSPASVRVRRARAFATTLSVCSLGLGFAWALVDEDRLAWHDRMTQTYEKKAG